MAKFGAQEAKQGIKVDRWVRSADWLAG